MKITAKGHIKNGRLVINKSELPVFLHKISTQKNKPVNVIEKKRVNKNTVFVHPNILER